MCIPLLVGECWKKCSEPKRSLCKCGPIVIFKKERYQPNFCCCLFLWKKINQIWKKTMKNHLSKFLDIFCATTTMNNFELNKWQELLQLFESSLSSIIICFVEKKMLHNSPYFRNIHHTHAIALHGMNIIVGILELSTIISVLNYDYGHRNLHLND